MKLLATILLFLALAGCAIDRVAVERYEIRVSEDGELVAVPEKEK